MIVAKYIGDIGALPASVLEPKKPAPASLGRRRGANPSTLALKSSNTGLPGAMKPSTPARPAPSPVKTLAAARAATPGATRIAPTEISPPARPSSPGSSSSPAPFGNTYKPGSGSSGLGGGGGGSDPFFGGAGGAPIDVPIKDAYVSVSGGIPDGAFYAIMAVTAAAVGYVIWRRSRRK